MPEKNDPMINSKTNAIQTLKIHFMSFLWHRLKNFDKVLRHKSPYFWSWWELASSVFLLQKEMLHSLCRRGEGKVFFSVWLSQSESGQNGTKYKIGSWKNYLRTKNFTSLRFTHLQLGTARNCWGHQCQSYIAMRGPFQPSLSADKERSALWFDGRRKLPASAKRCVFLSLPCVAHRSLAIHFTSSGVRLHSRLRKLTDWVISDERLSWRHINCLTEDSAVNEILRPPSLPH